MEEGITWTALLRKLDVAVCVFFFLFIMIASTAFLAFLSCRSGTKYQVSMQKIHFE